MKIGIIGSGFVGSTAAFAILMQGIGREIILVDKNRKRSAAEADDLYHAVPFAYPLMVREGDYPDLSGCRVIIISAGVSQKPGESRIDLLKRNAAVFRDIIPSILKNAPEAVLIVATNPVDIMTHLTVRFATEGGFPAHRIFGSGTTLDTARFRTLLGQHLGIDAPHVHAYVIGEHGDTEVLPWSLVKIGSVTLKEFCDRNGVCLDERMKQEIDDRVRNAAYRIIEGKGATYYGIGSALAKLTDVVLHDQRAILSVCTPIDEVAGVSDVTLSLPHLVGGDGVLTRFPLTLQREEEAALHRSAATLRQYLDGLETV